MDKKKIIQLVLAVLILVFSVLSWYLLKNALGQPEGDEWINRILWPSISFVVLGSFIGLAYLVEDDWQVLLGILLLIVAPFFIFFNSINYGKLAVVGAAMLFIWRGIHRSRQEKKEKIKLVPAEILLKSLAPTVTGLALLASIGFYGSTYAQSSATSEIIVPKGFFNAIIDPLLSTPEAIKNLSATQTTPDMAQATTQESEAIKDSVYQQLNKYLNTTGNSFKKFLPFGLATSFFFVIRFWGAILMKLSAMLAWAWFGAMRLLGLVKIGSVSVEKEMIEI